MSAVAPETGSGLRSAFGVLRAGFVIVAICAVIGGVLGAAFVLTRSVTYRSSVTLYVDPYFAAVPLTGSAPVPQEPSRSINSRIQVLQSARIHDEAAALLGRSMTTTPVVTGIADPGADIITMRVSASTPEEAEEVVEAYQTVYLDYWREFADSYQLRAIEVWKRQEQQASRAADRAIRAARAQPGNSALIQQQVAASDALNIVRNNLETAQSRLAATDTGIVVITPVTPATSVRSPALPSGVLSGVLLGMAVGSVLAIARYIVTGRLVTSEADIPGEAPTLSGTINPKKGSGMGSVAVAVLAAARRGNGLVALLGASRGPAPEQLLLALGAALEDVGTTAERFQWRAGPPQGEYVVDHGFALGPAQADGIRSMWLDAGGQERAELVPSLAQGVAHLDAVVVAVDGADRDAALLALTSAGATTIVVIAMGRARKSDVVAAIRTATALGGQVGGIIPVKPT